MESERASNLDVQSARTSPGCGPKKMVPLNLIQPHVRACSRLPALPNSTALLPMHTEKEFVVQVRFTVNLVELRKACRRLVLRLSVESEIGTDFALFNATGRALKISTKYSSEILDATIYRSGRATIPRPVFCSLVRALYYCRGQFIEFEFSFGSITISGRTQIRHPRISFASSNAKISASSSLG